MGPEAQIDIMLVKKLHTKINRQEARHKHFDCSNANYLIVACGGSSRNYLEKKSFAGFHCNNKRLEIESASNAWKTKSKIVKKEILKVHTRWNLMIL